MADFMSVEQRSAAMSAVRGKDTAIERSLRSSLHRRGFRFKKNVRGLPGQPDIVLPKYGLVIFVHGCFWHHHLNCKRSKLPSVRREFWTKKIQDNVRRDQQQIKALRGSNWEVKVVWECELRKDPMRVVEELVRELLRA